MRRYLLCCLVLLSLALQAEIRSVWILPWDISSPAAVDEIVQGAIDNNQNELLVEVRYRSDALYDTSLGADQYPNPEPRSHVLKNDCFDPLKDVLIKAHAKGLQVQAWVIVFNATPLDNSLIQQNYIYKNHRDWITQSSSGSKFNGSNQFGYFLDPGVPEVQDYLLSVLSNLAAGYPELDGIHLDYIRYPESNLGYHPISVLRYEEYCRNQSEITFNEWRIMQISSFVEKVYGRMKEINPRLRLTAAVFADIADANVAYAQDWPDWLRRGIIDQVYPMAYNVRFDRHRSQLERMKLVGTDERIIIGHRAWDDKGRSLANLNGGYYNISDLVKRIDLARELGFGGVAMFSYAGLKVGNAWQKLTPQSFATPVSYPKVNFTKLPEPQAPTNADVQPETAENEYLGDTTKLEAKLVKTDGHLLLLLSLPGDGYWNYEIWDESLLMSGQRYFQQGESKEFLEIPDSRELFQFPDKLVVQLFRDESEYIYLLPVELTELNE